MRGVLLAVLIALAAFALRAVGAELAAPGPSSIRVLSDTTLSGVAAKARDLRWASEGSVLLAVSNEGTIEAPLAELTGGQTPRMETAVSADAETGTWLSNRLGASPSFLAVTSGLFELVWRRRGEPSRVDRIAFMGIEDLDVQGDHVVALGLRRAEDGGRERGALWLGSLERSLGDLRPLALPVPGGGEREVDACGCFGIAAVRFLGDGSFVVAPGAMPGIFHYGASGRLLGSWDGEALGLHARCEFGEEELLLRSASPRARWAWLNGYRLVDDVLSLSSGPAVIVRELPLGAARWHLRRLLPDGLVGDVEPIPVTSPSRFARLRADVLDGHRIAFLVLEEEFPDRPMAPARLVLAETVEGG